MRRAQTSKSANSVPSAIRSPTGLSLCACDGRCGGRSCVTNVAVETTCFREYCATLSSIVAVVPSSSCTVAQRLLPGDTGGRRGLVAAFVIHIGNDAPIDIRRVHGTGVDVRRCVDAGRVDRAGLRPAHDWRDFRKGRRRIRSERCPGVTVTLRGEGVPGAPSVVTSETGAYRFPLLPAGRLRPRIRARRVRHLEARDACASRSGRHST